ncbi:MAG: hypothetical protein C0403_01090 [Desulfobacterium sp.]|nr:hypothetical protein [Desulfobacterium sp.]
MHPKNKLLIWLLLPLLANISIFFYLHASNLSDFNTQKENEGCILCHVKTVNQSMSNQFQHEPFFNRQCDKCHLPLDSNVDQYDQTTDTGMNELEGITGTKTSDTNPAGTKHPQMNDPEAASIDACYSCHTLESLGTTHSIRVYSGNNTKIPSDLPTVKGGMITCVTCHHPHGGEAKYFVRKIITTKLCISCHYSFKGTSKSTTFGD